MCEEPRLLPVTVVAQQAQIRAAVGTVGPMVQIELAGAILRVGYGVSPSTLRMVLDALRGTAP